jgi:hypothetical protein
MAHTAIIKINQKIDVAHSSMSKGEIYAMNATTHFKLAPEPETSTFS